MDDPLLLAIVGGMVGGASGALVRSLVDHAIVHLLKNQFLCIPGCIFLKNQI